jgi:hypothetical protein
MENSKLKKVALSLSTKTRADCFPFAKALDIDPIHQGIVTTHRPAGVNLFSHDSAPGAAAR